MFRLTFVNKDRCEPIFKVEAPGLDGYEWAVRNGHPCEYLGGRILYDVQIILSPEQARKIGKFADRSSVFVEVMGNLNKYKKCDTCYDNGVTYLPDEEAIFVAWEAAGFPLKWNVEKSTNPEDMSKKPDRVVVWFPIKNIRELSAVMKKLQGSSIEEPS